MVGNNSNLEIFNRIKETNANSADEYNNTKTYVKDEYCIYNNTLYKANQAIDTAEEFTESHWTETTVGTELKSQADSISALNSRIQLDTIEISIPKGSVITSSAYRVGDLIVFSVAFNVATTINENENFIQFSGISAKSRFDFAIRDSNTTIGDGALLTGTNGIIANAISLNPGGYFCAGAFVVN